jgi:metal-sulfur cluster biosynthetic enzyme
MSLSPEKEKAIRDALHEVIDPELHLPITELGLIYGVEATDQGTRIRMTLTSMGCPLFPVIEQQVKSVVAKIEGTGEIEVELTFDPIWTIEMMSESARAQLGFM